MMMEMELSVQKAKENNIDIEECYKKVDDFFRKHGVKKIGKGIYKGNKKDFDTFMKAQWDLPTTAWFLKIVDNWYFRYEGDTIEYREDALKSYYEVEARYADFVW
ncbi:hypothetical protein B5E92_11190 [Erysipelatoclostridium sp. An15]|uniref:hypothetical protein n=1 Tax=Erysipelatoclostridium sp. An15 TaxID=1965566 RepID=UPI000B374C0A|nr:hypothetical protein [Erysipelatoclostridium sp. An15]OUQ06772.1 hypothetical protein B5E92_11190 [Erysipelatoclostridium sp. An15]